jgi:ankyrin repeat protein
MDVDIFGCTPEGAPLSNDELLAAFSAGDLETVKRACKHATFTVDNALDKEGTTPLIAAARGGYPDLVSLVLSYHADMARCDLSVSVAQCVTFGW